MIPTTYARHGELSLRFAQRDHTTALVDSFFRPPLQVMQPIKDGTGCLMVYLLSPSGGVVQGDRYQIEIIAEADTHALFTTQAATKIYRMPHDCASQEIRIEVHPGAVLEFIPDAAILFGGANFHQHIQVTLHPNAAFMMQDIVMPGRLARGEVMQFDTYASRITVRDSQGLLLYEPTRLQPATQDYHRLGILEGHHCWGNWYFFGDGINWEAFCQQTHSLFDDLPDAIGSISRLHRKGSCARILSPFLSPIYAQFERLRQIARTDYLGRPYAPLRK